MPIFDKLKAQIVLFFQPHKNQINKSDKKNNLSDILGRNGLSDEEWEAKKREHPGLFSEPCTNHVTRVKEEGSLSDILGRNGLSDEEWEAKKREHPGYFVEPSFNHMRKTE